MAVTDTIRRDNSRFLRACRREPTDVTPVWFMRQAGRYMPEYRALRAKHTLLEICKKPELALEVTLQPLRLGVDAAILFADILLPLEPMGAPFEFAKGEGPVIHEPDPSTRADRRAARHRARRWARLRARRDQTIQKELDGRCRSSASRARRSRSRAT